MADLNVFWSKETISLSGVLDGTAGDVLISVFKKLNQGEEWRIDANNLAVISGGADLWASLAMLMLKGVKLTYGSSQLAMILQFDNQYQHQDASFEEPCGEAEGREMSKCEGCDGPLITGGCANPFCDKFPGTDVLLRAAEERVSELEDRTDKSVRDIFAGDNDALSNAWAQLDKMKKKRDKLEEEVVRLRGPRTHKADAYVIDPGYLEKLKDQFRIRSKDSKSELSANH